MADPVFVGHAAQLPIGWTNLDDINPVDIVNELVFIELIGQNRDHLITSPRKNLGLKLGLAKERLLMGSVFVSIFYTNRQNTKIGRASCRERRNTKVDTLLQY